MGVNPPGCLPANFATGAGLLALAVLGGASAGRAGSIHNGSMGASSRASIAISVRVAPIFRWRPRPPSVPGGGAAGSPRGSELCFDSNATGQRFLILVAPGGGSRHFGSAGGASGDTLAGCLASANSPTDQSDTVGVTNGGSDSTPGGGPAPGNTGTPIGSSDSPSVHDAPGPRPSRNVTLLIAAQ